MSEGHVIFFALVIMFAGGFLQGAVGFGLGLFCVPLLLTVGFPVSVVLAMVAVGTVVQAASGVHRLRHSVPWRAVWFALAVRACSMAAGIWVVRVLTDYPIASLKFWIGSVVAALVVLQAWWQPLPRPKLHPAWNLTAFLASGFTGGLCSMGGPPLVLWVMAHDWTTEKTRGFLFASFMCLVPVQLALLYLSFGQDSLRGALMGLALSPAVLAGSLAGLRVGGRFSKLLLRRLAFALLMAIALNAMYPRGRQWLENLGKDQPPASENADI